MMTPRQLNPDEKAEMTLEAVASKVIRQFARMTDSCAFGSEILASPWEEFVVQVQGEEAPIFYLYREELEALILAAVRKLPLSAQAAVWLQTEEGRDWLEDFQDSGKRAVPLTLAPVDEMAVVESVYRRVWTKAADFSNDNIESFKASTRLEP